MPPKRRTLVEALNETKELQARRVVFGGRLDRGRRESLVQADAEVAMMSYRNALGVMTERTAKLIDRHVVSAITAPFDVRAVEHGLFALENDLLRQATTVGRYAEAAYKRTSQHVRTEAQRILNVRIPIDQVGQFESSGAFVRRQVALLQKAARDQVDAIRVTIARTQDPEKLRSEVARQVHITRNRTRLVARMEVHHLSNREMMRWSQLVGAEGGIYHTRRDELVRPTHAVHDGIYYLYAELPPTLGDAGCRCRVIPDVAYLEDE